MDQVSPLKALITGPLTLPTTSSFVLPVIDYPLTTSEDLIVAFDISSGGVRRLTTGVDTCNAYVNAGATEASTENRSPSGWATRDQTVYLIEKIEVLTG